jgi:hypothetical protein
MVRIIGWPDGGPPPFLLKFKPSDWDAPEREAFELWVEACKAYAELHSWPGGPAALLKLMRDTRLQLGQDSAPE